MSNRQLVCFLSNSVVTRPSPFCNTAIDMIECSTFISAPAQPFEEGYIDFLSGNRTEAEKRKWKWRRMRSSLRKVWRPLHENLLRRLHEIKYWGIDQKWAQDCDEDVGAHNWRHVGKAVYVSARLRADWRRGIINNAEKMWPSFADLCCTSINASQIGRIATVFERSGGIVANKKLRNTEFTTHSCER